MLSQCLYSFWYVYTFNCPFKFNQLLPWLTWTGFKPPLWFGETNCWVKTWIRFKPVKKQIVHIALRKISQQPAPKKRQRERDIFHLDSRNWCSLISDHMSLTAVGCLGPRPVVVKPQPPPHHHQEQLWKEHLRPPLPLYHWLRSVLAV